MVRRLSSSKTADRKARHQLTDEMAQISAVVRDGERRIGEGELQYVPISRVFPDPDQPRQDLPTKNEVTDYREGRLDLNVYVNTPKEGRFERLKGLAHTIKEDGLLQPIIVFPVTGGDYQIVAGERRWLSHVYLDEPEIRAIVKPSRREALRLYRAQIIENIQREDLTPWEQVESVRRLDGFHQNEHGEPIGREGLMASLGLGRSQAYLLLSLLRAPEDVMQALREGKIKSFERADQIARIDDEETRKSAIDGLASAGQSNNPESPSSASASPKRKKSKAGAPPKAVTLGRTKNLLAIRRVMEASKAAGVTCELDDVDWDDIASVKSAWEMFWKQMETIDE